MNKPNIRFRKEREDINTAIENAYSQRPVKNCYQRWLPVALAALLVITLSLAPRVTKAAPDAGLPVGLWSTVVHAPDDSFSFKAFELWGGDGTFIGSGQIDLTPEALGSSAWGVWSHVGPRQFRVIARFWTYDASANPTGFATVDFTFTLSRDGRTYRGEGTLQFFDNDGNPLTPPIPTLDDGTRIASP
jgi:hypothetical protein